MDFSEIKTEIQTNIRTNGNQEITGAILQETLIGMVDATEENITEIESKVGIFKKYNVVAGQDHSSRIDQLTVNVAQGDVVKLQYKTNLTNFTFTVYHYYADGEREYIESIEAKEYGERIYTATKDIIAIGIYWQGTHATQNGILECRAITDTTIEPRVAELEEKVSELENSGSSITSVVVSVDDNTGTPSADANLNGGVLNLHFSGLKGEGISFDVISVTSEDQMTDATKLYALNGEIYRYEGEVGVNDVADATASESGEIPLFTNLYDKSNAQINTRVSTSSTSTMNGAMLTNWLDIPMNSAIANPIVRIKGLPNPSSYGTHDYDRIVCLKDGVEDKTDGKWNPIYMMRSSGYTKEVLDDGTLVLTMTGDGLPERFGKSGSVIYSPRFCFQDINGDGSAIVEAPDLIITLNEEIEYGELVPTNKGRWVNTHIEYDADASQMILDNLGELQGYVEIPTYWESEMVDTIEKVAGLKKDAGNDAISFAWCSDAHVIVNTSAEGDTSHLGELMWKATKDTFTPLAISTGDEQNGASLATKELLMENFAEMKRHFSPLWGKKEFIALLGNHDGAYGEADDSGLYYQRQLPPEEMFYEYFSEQILDFRRVFSRDGTYFYIDTPQKVRFICLNTHYVGDAYEVDEDGFAVFDRFNTSCLGQAQYDWLISEALDMPSDEWSCIIASHIAPILDGNLAIPSGDNPAYNYSASFLDRAVLAGVLNAFTAKTTYVGAYTAGTDGWNNVSVDCNFSNYKGSIICYIAGHWHRDLTENKSLNGVPIILITSAKDDRDTSLPPRTDGTDQETAFDVVVINRKTRKIHCIRCGAGEDRTITY